MPPSKRWETTTQQALSSTASRLHEVENRSEMTKKLKERKIANRTSVVFGFDDMSYETDAMMRQKDILGAGKKEYVDGKAMKKALTATHFVLGNDDLDYVTQIMDQERKFTTESAKVRDLQAQTGEGTTLKIPKPTTRKSSCYFGSDVPSYRTTATDSMALSANALAELGDRSNMRARAKELKAELSGHNFALGNDELTYKTTSNDAFQYEQKSALASRGALFEGAKADLRREHFNFGTEPVHYETDMMRSMRGCEINATRLAEMKDDAKASKDLKHKLLATSVIIGDDPDYH